MSWADLKRLTRTEARWNKRLKRPDWFTKIKAYNRPLSRNFRTNWAGYGLTVWNPPYWSICWALYKRNVRVEISPCWSLKYELSFGDAIVSRNDCILVSAALHPKDPDYQMKLRIWAKVQPLIRRSTTSLWWPKMNKQLIKFLDTCEGCNAYQIKNQVTDPGQKLGLIFLSGSRNTIWF